MRGRWQTLFVGSLENHDIFWDIHTTDTWEVLKSPKDHQGREKHMCDGAIISVATTSRDFLQVFHSNNMDDQSDQSHLEHIHGSQWTSKFGREDHLYALYTFITNEQHVVIWEDHLHLQSTIEHSIYEEIIHNQQLHFYMRRSSTTTIIESTMFTYMIYIIWYTYIYSILYV